MPTAIEQIQRAFSGFSQVAKRDAKAPGAIEIDLGKVASGLGALAFENGTRGDVATIEKALDEIDVLLSKAYVVESTDAIVVPASEIAKRYAVDVEKAGPANEAGPGDQYTNDGGVPGLPMTAGESVATKKPKPAPKNQYTAGSGVADQASDKDMYTGTSAESVGKPPSGGKPGTTFDQTPGGPNVGKAGVAKAKKAQQPAHPETPGSPGMLLTENQIEPQDGMVSEGFGLRGKTKRVAKSADGEVRWGLDMAAEREEEISVRKAAKKKAAGSGALDGEGDSDDEPLESESTDDRSDASAKGKKTAKAGGKRKAQFDGPEESVDELEDEDRDAEAAAATKPNTTNDASGPEESVDTVGGGKRAAAKKGGTKKDYDSSKEVDETEDEDEDGDEKTEKKGKPFAGAAKPFGSNGKDDDGDEDDDSSEKAKKTSKKGKPFPPKDDDGDEDDSEDDDEDEAPKKGATKKVAKRADGIDAEDDGTMWEDDMAPGESPVRKAERLTAAEVPLAARPGMRQTAAAVARIRKSALARSGDVATSPEVLAQFARHRQRVEKRASYDPTHGGTVETVTSAERVPAED